jgi:hypothetical protein
MDTLKLNLLPKEAINLIFRCISNPICDEIRNINKRSCDIEYFPSRYYTYKDTIKTDSYEYCHLLDIKYGNYNYYHYKFNHLI